MLEVLRTPKLKSPERRALCTFVVATNHTEVRMLRKGDFVEIQALAKAGVYQKDIAAKLSPRRKTVPRTATYGSAYWSVRGPALRRSDPPCIPDDRPHAPAPGMTC